MKLSSEFGSQVSSVRLSGWKWKPVCWLVCLVFVRLTVLPTLGYDILATTGTLYIIIYVGWCLPGMWHIRLVKLKQCWIKNWKGQVIWTWLASWRFFGYSKTPTCNFKRFCLSKRLHNYKDSKCWSYRWKGEKKNEGRLKIKHRFHNKKKKKILICITLGLAWRPEGKRRPSRIKTQWRRIVEVVEEERHTDGWQWWQSSSSE